MDTITLIFTIIGAATVAASVVRLAEWLEGGK